MIVFQVWFILIHERVIYLSLPRDESVKLPSIATTVCAWGDAILA